MALVSSWGVASFRAGRLRGLLAIADLGPQQKDPQSWPRQTGLVGSTPGHLEGGPSWAGMWLIRREGEATGLASLLCPRAAYQLAPQPFHPVALVPFHPGLSPAQCLAQASSTPWFSAASPYPFPQLRLGQHQSALPAQTVGWAGGPPDSQAHPQALVWSKHGVDSMGEAP